MGWRGERGGCRTLIEMATLVAIGALASCGSGREIPQAEARPGDLLVISHGQQIELVKTFRAAVPNSLLDGVVRLRGDGPQALLEINAVCSMPSLEGWPPYDNLYGRKLKRPEEAVGPTGNTEWQELFHFSGRQETTTGTAPGAWVARLRDNLCRRGDFKDNHR